MAGDLLAPILERKRRENARRHAHLGIFDPQSLPTRDRRPDAWLALRRDSALRVIAEIKHRSPSEGTIRARAAGGATAIALDYADAGASAISVLCDRAGFGGSVLDLRRAAAAVDRPLLFKEFVLDPLQIDLAAAAGASMVLLLVRALSLRDLQALVGHCHARGLEAVVEAADADEVDRALDTDAKIVGVNARDLSSFRIDGALAANAIEKIPKSRIAVYMSGVASRTELQRIADGRADAVLIGTALMRAADPGARLRELLGVPLPARRPPEAP